MSNPPKPILKWVGGKTQILDHLIENFPTGEICNYREIFLGGGSVLLALLDHVKKGNLRIRGNVYAYDINEPLIYVYKNIQNKHIDLLENIRTIITHFRECDSQETINRRPSNIDEAKENKENFYYWTRSNYNNLSPEEKKTTKGSAMLIFLNKTCFRGLFRVGPNGFNVPYGHYKNPEIINEKHLREIHDLIKDVIFECRDFTKSLPEAGDGDFVYIDPPYVPENISSFVGYTKDGFSSDNHKKLFQAIHNLTKKKIKMILSNSDVDFIRESFPQNVYAIQNVLCKRSINSKNPKAKTMEVIIRNYQTIS